MDEGSRRLVCGVCCRIGGSRTMQLMAEFQPFRVVSTHDWNNVYLWSCGDTQPDRTQNEHPLHKSNLIHTPLQTTTSECNFPSLLYVSTQKIPPNPIKQFPRSKNILLASSTKQSLPTHHWLQITNYFYT